MNDRILDLERRQADLEKRIADLERRANEQMPWPAVPSIPSYPEPWGVDDARCSVCQGRFKDMTHYVCNHPGCPSRVTCMATATAETPQHLRGSTCDHTYHPPADHPCHEKAATDPFP